MRVDLTEEELECLSEFTDWDDLDEVDAEFGLFLSTLHKKLHRGLLKARRQNANGKTKLEQHEERERAKLNSIKP
jgi:hypothetical protein